jgi:hypothetical protein
MTRTSLLSAVVVSAVIATACGARGVRIADLKDQPGRYDDRSVSITGTVTNSFGIPLVPFQVYEINDGSGEITVLSRSGSGAPNKGARVQVRGKVGQVATFGGRSFGLHIQEENRKIRGS